MCQLEDGLSFRPGHHQQFYLLPSPLSDTVQQAVLDNKVRGWMWRRLNVLSLNHSHLFPTILKPIVPELLFGEISPSSNLLEHIKE
jgi:hypothetical protein